MKIVLLTLSFVIVSLITFGQTTLTLQPDAVAGKDAMLHGAPTEVNVNYGTANQFAAAALTFSGSPGIVRGIVEFDLSSIPVGATVQSAYLSFYAIDFTTGLGQHSTLSGPNDCWLRRVTSSWNESSVTWNTAPTFTTQNEVSIPASSSPTQDYPNINVTALVQDMVNNPSVSFGFLFMLQNEQYYRNMNFCSSDHAIPSKRPKLEVTYIMSSITCQTITISAGAGGGQDAFVHGASTEVNVMYGNNNQLAAAALTFSGNPGVIRSLIEFDLSGIPSNVILDSALISLYAIDFTTGLGQHSTLSGPNDAWLQRITSSWNQSTVTWNSQPTSTAVNQVHVPASTSPTQDYVNLDVLPLVTDILANPSSSFGFMLKLQNETYYRNLNFCSSNHANPLKHPQLKVCYHSVAGVDESSKNNYLLVLFPNPVTNEITVQSETFKVESVDVFSVLGKRLTLNPSPKGEGLRVDVSSLASGIYFVKVRGEKQERVAKFVKQ